MTRRMPTDGVAWGLPGCTVVEDLSALRWLSTYLASQGERPPTSRKPVPSGFESYVRLLHPFYKSQFPLQPKKVRWAEVTKWSGRALRADMPWQSLTDPLPGYGTSERPWDDEPWNGSMEKHELTSLIHTLMNFTRTPELCYFAVWDGHGEVPQDPNWPPRLQGYFRKYAVFVGPLTQLSTRAHDRIGHILPDLWWPKDRSWFVGGDVDLDSTYVAGNPQCIEALLANPNLEAVPVRDVDDGI